MNKIGLNAKQSEVVEKTAKGLQACELILLLNKVLATNNEIELSSFKNPPRKTIDDLCEIIRILHWNINSSGPHNCIGFTDPEIEDWIKESVSN